MKPVGHQLAAESFALRGPARPEFLARGSKDLDADADELAISMFLDARSESEELMTA